MLPLHPKLVHLPIALAVLMPAVSVGLFWAWRTRRIPRRVWWVAAVCQLLLAATALLAVRTGGQEEERVERVVPEHAIEAHEEAAEAFLWVAAAVAVLFVGSACVRREQVALSLGALAAGGTLVVLALAVRTGDAGGRLVYQYGAGSAYTAAAPAAADGTARARGNGEKDDDD